MFVYRVFREEEINKIFDSYSFCNLDSSNCSSKLNNHNCQSNRRYLFFADKDSILY